MVVTFYLTSSSLDLYIVSLLFSYELPTLSPFPTWTCLCRCTCSIVGNSFSVACCEWSLEDTLVMEFGNIIPGVRKLVYLFTRCSKRLLSPFFLYPCTSFEQSRCRPLPTYPFPTLEDFRSLSSLCMYFSMYLPTYLSSTLSV